MRTKALLAGLGAALIITPFIASAASITGLQAQISALLAQIQSLQGSATSSASISASAPSVPMIACPIFSRSLSIGSRGGDVSSLQGFLHTQGYLNVSSTGYFGALTKAALAKWQSDNSIATSGNPGSGIFGPLSRSFFGRRCGDNPPGQQSFSANPRSGAAPLTVTFTTREPITASSTTYSVDFGDGSAAAMTKGECIAITAVVGGQGGIRCSYTVSHTYSSNGTYTARLMKNTCPLGAQCLVGPLPIASTTITVDSSASTSLSFTASPTSGVAPLSVQFTATAPQGTSLGTTVNFGDGTTGTLGFVPVCSSCNAMGTVSHTYANPGTYTATLTNNLCSCPANGICNCPNSPILGFATVTVTATGTASANIQQLNAPGSVTLAQSGIAEIRNESYYFTLTGLTAATATIQITPVGCWNWFPSDTPPQMRCMIAVVPIAPQTLTVGESTTVNNKLITLNSINNATATFAVGVPATASPVVTGGY